MKKQVIQNGLFALISVGIITGTVYGLSFVEEKQDAATEQVAESNVSDAEIQQKESEKKQSSTAEKEEKGQSKKEVADTKEISSKNLSESFKRYASELNKNYDSVEKQKKAAEVLFNEVKPYLTEKELDYYKQNIDYQLFAVEKSWEAEANLRKQGDVDSHEGAAKIVEFLKDLRMGVVEIKQEVQEYDNVPKAFLDVHNQKLDVLQEYIILYDNYIKVFENEDLELMERITKNSPVTHEKVMEEGRLLDAAIGTVMTDMEKKVLSNFSKK